MSGLSGCYHISTRLKNTRHSQLESNATLRNRKRIPVKHGVSRKRLNVFISSTSIDLIEWRTAIGQDLRRRGLNILTMDQFPAVAASGADGSREMVGRCDLFIGIYARRYGTVSEGKSITEIEYDAASKARLPRLCFMLSDKAQWLPDLEEQEPGRSQLRRFKEKVRQEVIVREFETLDELRQEATIAADEYLKTERRRWILRLGMTGVLGAVLFAIVIGLMLLISTYPELTHDEDWVLGVPGQLTTLAGNPSTDSVAIGTSDGSIYFWPTITDRNRGGKILTLRGEIRNLAVTRDGGVIIAETEEGKVTALTQTGHILWTQSGMGGIRNLAVHPQTSEIAIGSKEASVQVYSARGELVKEINFRHQFASNADQFDVIWNLAWASGNRSLAVGFRSGAIYTIDLAQDKIVNRKVEDKLFTEADSLVLADNNDIIMSYQQRNTPEFRLVVLKPNGDVVEIGKSTNMFDGMVLALNNFVLTDDWNGNVSLWDLKRQSKVSESSVSPEVLGPYENDRTLFGIQWLPRTQSVIVINFREILFWKIRWKMIGGFSSPWRRNSLW